MPEPSSPAPADKKKSGPSILMLALGMLVGVAIMAILASQCKGPLSARREPTPTATPTPRLGPAVFNWYFAEGSSVSPQRTTYSILNAGSENASVTVDLYSDSGRVNRRQQIVPPNSEYDMDGGVVMPGAMFAATVRSTAPVYVERLTQVTGDGAASPAAGRASPVWYFADAGGGDFRDVSLKVLNLDAADTLVTARLYADDGVVKTVPFQAPSGKVTLQRLGESLPVGPRSLVVRSDTPVVAELTVGTSDGHLVYTGSAISPEDLSKTWYVPVVTTTLGSTTTISILNASDSIAKVLVSKVEGRLNRRLASELMLPGSRRTITAGNTWSGIMIESDVPLAVQSTTVNPEGKAPYAFGSLAAPGAQRTWYLPQTPGDARNASYLAIFNPYSLGASVDVTYLYYPGDQIAGSDGAQKQSSVTRSYTVRSGVRLVWQVQVEANKGREGEALRNVVATIVSSSRPVVAGRVTMFRGTGGAAASIGAPQRVEE